MTEQVEDKAQETPEVRPIKNIDAMIVAAQAPEPVEQKKENVSHETPDESKSEIVDTDANSSNNANLSDDDAPIVEDKSAKSEVDNKSQKVDKDSEKVDKDEYGNILTGKQKLYTEEEVNQRIRERLKRGAFAEQQQPPVLPQTPTNTPESSEDDSWEVQLEGMIDKTLQKKQQQAQELQWQQQQRQQQSEFEEKFSAGMSKYQDFKEVVSGKPLTDTMMLATRSMNNPAAFVYAAAKTQAAELERIAKIPDPLLQAAEIGRLEEKMKKARAASAAAKPIRAAKSDMAEGKEIKKQSLDSLIHQHAKSKFRR